MRFYGIRRNLMSENKKKIDLVLNDQNVLAHGSKATSVA